LENHIVISFRKWYSIRALYD